MRQETINFTLRGSLRRCHIMALLLFALFLAACSQPDFPEPNTSANNILVAPEFITYYESFGGARIFGQAETEPLINRETGHIIQYFERIRLDFDPARPAAEQVYPFALGSWALAGALQFAEIETDPDIRSQTFPGSDYPVADPFLQLYESVDGVVIFGLPISPRIWQGDVRTQYFENVRLEWHPGFPEGERVQVGLLGQAHWLATAPAGFEFAFSANPLAGLDAVELKTSVEFPLLYDDDVQTVHIKAVTGQQPVPDLAIELQLPAEDGIIPLGRTDGAGSLHATIPDRLWQPGEWIELTILALNSDGETIGQSIVRFKRW